jgi:hypothetical protein
MPRLWRGAAVQAGRRRDRDARGDPPLMEGDPDRARAVLVPGLRDDHPATRAVPCGAPQMGWPELPRHAAVREVRPAPASQPPDRALRPRGRAAEHLNAGRPGRCGHLCSHAALPADRGSCAGRRALARRRYDGAGHGQGQDRYGKAVDLRPR